MTQRALLVLALSAFCGFSQSRGGKAPAKAPAKPTPAQTQPAPVDKWPIASVAVAGNHIYTAAQVIALSGLKVGDLAGKAEFDAATDRITATGAFETAGYKFMPNAEGTGNNAILQVTEAPVFYPVKFEELGVPDSDVEKLLASRDPLFSMANIPTSQVIFDRYIGWIEELLTVKGRPEKLMAKVLPTGPGEYAIVFRPSKNPPSVAQVTFEGNHLLTQLALRDAVSTAAVGTPYSEKSFREMLNIVVRGVYEARGRMHVTFPKIRTEPVSDVAGLHVFVTVDEGEVYTLGKVAIPGPSPLDAIDLLKDANLKTGDIANFDLVSAALERIRKKIWRAGYLDVAVNEDRKLIDETKVVDVAIRIDAGPQYKAGKLTIKGLDIEGEREINRIWTMKEGKPYNPEYADFFLKSVREQGLFDNLGQAKQDTQVDRKSHTATITLTFSGSTGAGPTRH